MFNGQEKKRIEELQALIEAMQADHLESLADHADELKNLQATHTAEVMNLKQDKVSHDKTVSELHAEDKKRLMAQHSEDIASFNERIAELRGQLEQSEKAALKWWKLSNGWRFHKGGSKEVEGVVYTLYEARTDDPTINIRILVPEGETFP